MGPDKIIEIHSEKYDVKGRIENYANGLVIKLKFTYGGREYTLGLHKGLKGDLAETGLRAMETVIERLASTENKERFLHYWYIFEHKGNLHANGNVTGHPKVNDSVRINTSPIVSVRIDEERGEALIVTDHSAYHCPLEYWRFRKQDKRGEVKMLIPDYDALREKYKDKIVYPEIEPGKVLLVLADFCNYYFHSLCVKDENGKKLEYESFAHVGTFQDSFLIYSTDNPNIDLRYFPHFKNIEFYDDSTDGMPLYAENVGSADLYINRDKMIFCLKPGERKELAKENAETDVNDLPDGDLYPAGT